ncbi:glycosyltransferase family 2 protein [Cellvibrio japonicus]|uniref:Glycosyl transferase, putative, gt2G n=1 Tax=Cellvibrio japonicus (strain Ueda107) TaxID=498211 RepID=B3PFY7_CELJU|nr:glycosyltransferase [Cellvibrio japonicus]ACE82861.1 glycosyl transferase, putative, gt2G [Cellvibrio japonicus Ueda107]
MSSPTFNFNIESVFRIGKGTGLIGWALDIQRSIETITLKSSIFKSRTFHLGTETELIRTHRPDVCAAFNLPDNHTLGFVIWLPVELDPHSEIIIHFDDHVNLAQGHSPVQLGEGERNLFIEQSYSHSGMPLRQLATKFDDPTFLFALHRVSRQLLKDTSTSPSIEPALGICSVDYAFNLDNRGILLLGWYHFLGAAPTAIHIIRSTGEPIEIQQPFSIARPDVQEHLKSHYSGVQQNCGFLSYIEYPLNPAHDYALRFKFNQGELWVHFSLANDHTDLTLVKKILESIPCPQYLTGSIYNIYNSGLGKAIEAISIRYKRSHPAYTERQFGIPPTSPHTSVIVPLYGRYDFMRHQLAHFVHDRDFDDVDLIYVVDDPAIKESAISTAISYYALFRKPFRVVWYDCNLGFAGANNIGVSAARAEHLLLMNSDVIPQEPGWLTILRNAYMSLPNPGILGPLLQFSDNSTQHAGMKANRDPYLPGFLLNGHPGKGWLYYKATEPSEQQLLTAACIFLSKQDYVVVGGFDEGYLIGDFEDSDLCMAIKKMGKKLWLVPEAKLWHLERQSQNIGSISGYRQLITLYNGWRYHEKIIRGEIANPEEQE